MNNGSISTNTYLKADLANQQAPAQMPQAPQQSQAQQGNWFERLLPTIGGIGGGILGSLTDSFTGPLGTIAGSAAGGALGQQLENALTGSKGSTLAAGAENALGAGVGKGLSYAGEKLVGAGTSALEGSVAKNTAQAAQNAETQAKLTEANRIRDEFSAIHPGQANVGSTLTKLKSLGIENPTAQDALQVGNVYTGSNPKGGTGVLNFYKQQSIDQAGGTVNLSNTIDNLKNTLTNPENKLNLGSLEPVSNAKGQLPTTPNNVSNKILQQVRDMLPDGSLDNNGQIIQTLGPKDATKLLSNIGDKIDSTTPVKNALGNLDPAQVSENNVWKSLYKDVRTQTYDRPEVDAVISKLNVGPDESAVIDDAIRSNGITDPKIAANIKADLTNTINNSKTGNDLLKQESPMVNVSKVGRIQTKFVEDNPQMAKSATAIKSEVTSQAPQATTGSSAMTNLEAMAGIAGAPMTGGLSLLATLPKAVQIAKNPEVQQGVLSALQSKAGQAAGKIIPLATRASALGAANLPNLAASAQPTTNQGAGNMQPNVQSMIQQSPIMQAYNTALTGGAGIDQGYTSLLGQVAPQAQKLELAAPVLQNLLAGYGQAGGAQGPLGGALTKLSGLIPGTAANIYGNQQNTAAATLGQLLGISPQQAIGLLPQLTASAGTTSPQMQSLQSILGGVGGQ